MAESTLKVGIYNEPTGRALGGTEYCVALLAEALAAARHQVDIIHHRPGLTAEDLGARFDLDLGAVGMRHFEKAPEPPPTSNPLRRYRAVRDWQAEFSAPYDTFINFTHGMPPFCHARRGILVVLFPSYRRPYETLAPESLLLDSAVKWRRLRRVYFDWEWEKRMETYQVKTAISRYSQEWSKRRWLIDCRVINPPAETDFEPAEKRNLILSVGRFKGTGLTKRQLEMLAVFRDLKASGLREWTYASVGGLGEAREDADYFEHLRCIAEACGARVADDVGRAELKGLFEQAKVFWHAAGYNEDAERRPEMAEHYGIVTVEAMAAGCVPVVINRGGQPEIVQHGVNGFLWDTPDELAGYTRLLSENEALRARMAEAARSRSQQFNRERFVSSYMELL